MNRAPSRSLLIRVDANAGIGSGHLMRCLALAQAWQDAGGVAHFAAVDIPDGLAGRLASEGMTLHRLNVTPGGPEDAAQTVALALRLGATWVVEDGYCFDADYQRAIKDAGLRLLVIDDYGHAGHYWADLVLNQNAYIDGSLYYSRREPITRLLLGAQYVLLRREFLRWRDWQRSIPKIARKVLVTLGGSDPANATQKAVEALAEMPVDDFEAVVVVGGANPHVSALELAVSDSSRNIRIEHNVTDMPPLMAWADLAVSAAGSTCWELAYMGLPAVVTVLAENQAPVAKALSAAGSVVSLGWHTSLEKQAISNALVRILHDQELRTRLSQNVRELVDGHGPKRVVRRMSQLEIRLRPAQADDCRMIWNWTNDPINRTASFASELIPWESHEVWFEQRLSDPRCLFYIAKDGEGTPVGQVRYQIDGQEATISVSVAPEQRGRGSGSHIIYVATRQACEIKSLLVVHAYIKPDNLASARAFVNAGFVEQDLTQVQGHPARHFVFLRGGMP